MTVTMTERSESLARAIDLRREEQGFSTAEVATRCGWSEATFTKLVGRVSKITIDELDIIARALNTDTVGVMRDVEALAAGNPVGLEQQVVSKLPKWATRSFTVETPIGTNDEASLFASRDCNGGSMEIRADLWLDEESREVTITFARTPIFNASGLDVDEDRRYTLAEARSIAGGPDRQHRGQTALRELLDAYDAAGADVW